MPLVDRTLSPAAPTGQYAIVVNWNPQDPNFDLKTRSVQKGEFGKHVGSWTLAYQAALAAIEKLEDPMYRKILRRCLTPVPLQFLTAGVATKPCGEGDFAGAAYGWQFLGNTTDKFDVEVFEVDEVFRGTHDTR